MPILGTIASSTRQGLVTNNYESIASTTLGSDTSSVVFSSIPTNYAFLELRIVAKTNRGTSTDAVLIRFNNDSSGGNYNYAELVKEGTGTPGAGQQYNINHIFLERFPGSVSGANDFGYAIAAVYDYANTQKFTTVRSMGGVINSSQGVYSRAINYGIWRNTSTVTSITLVPNVGTNLLANSVFSLYGIRI